MPRLMRSLILGGLAAGAAYALRNNSTVKGLLGGGSDAPQPYTPPEPAPAPPVANVDVAGPPANTSTHVPAPDPVVHDPSGGIDEAAEEAAAAAEAANIGGTPEAYPSEEDPTLATDEALRPVEEAGGGYAEGQELAEADLIDNAEASAGDPIEGERAIEDAIEAQDDPSSGELLTDAPPPTGSPATDVPPPEDAPEPGAVTPATTTVPEGAEIPAVEKSSAVWRDTEQDTVEQPKVEEDESA